MFHIGVVLACFVVLESLGWARTIMPSMYTDPQMPGIRQEFRCVPAYLASLLRSNLMLAIQIFPHSTYPVVLLVDKAIPSVSTVGLAARTSVTACALAELASECDDIFAPPACWCAGNLGRGQARSRMGGSERTGWDVCWIWAARCVAVISGLSPSFCCRRCLCSSTAHLSFGHLLTLFLNSGA